MKPLLVVSVLLVFLADALRAQDIRVADSLFRAGQRAMESGDTAGYRRNSDSAAGLMPPGHLNRPFIQYHAARANALIGEAAPASRWLARMLDENIEGLMVWYSSIDVGFDRIRRSESYQGVVRRMNTLELQQTALGNRLLLLEGAGGNIVVAPSSEGVLVVDAGYEPGGRAVRRVLPQQTRAQWVVLTHAHEDHVGGIPALAQGATVLAHPEAITTLKAPQEFITGVSSPPSPLAQSMQPVTERRVIPLRGDSAVVIPLPAHSGGDLLVWFPEARVLVTGDNYLPGANPFLELGGIQDIQGYIVAMGDVIKQLPPDTKVVPGHGGVSTLEDFLAIHEKTRDGIEFVRSRKAAGVALGDIKSEGATLGLPGPWIERAYSRVLPTPPVIRRTSLTLPDGTFPDMSPCGNGDGYRDLTSMVSGSMRTRVWGSAVAVSVLSVACATNPVTGRSELSLVSESQEISMGQEAAKDVAASIGLYNDAQAQTYVSNLGKKLAALSERPHLPWSFQVVDDPAVNAFALPGGPIFVTRGIMTTLNSEAELAAVLGHEIGHVTAKHSVQMISRAQVAQIGLGVGSILSDNVASVAGLAGTGLSLLFLKYGRDAENQSDELGFKYSMNANYDVREMLDVFRTLERVGASSGGGGLPEWLSSHPNPGNRLAATQRRIDSIGARIPANAVVNRDGYLRIIDNMVYGENPRQGFFRGGLFLHPDLRFQIQFPNGWKYQNQTAAVVAVSSANDAAIQLTIAGNKTPEQANSEFFGQQGIRALQSNRTSINGNPAVSTAFEAQTNDGVVRGVATFISYGGNTYQILGYTPAAKIGSYNNDIMQTAGSFRTLTDQTALNAQPRRLALVRVPRAMTLEQFNAQYPSAVPIGEIGLINDLTAGQTIAAGTTVKRVTGNTP